MVLKYGVLVLCLLVTLGLANVIKKSSREPKFIQIGKHVTRGDRGHEYAYGNMRLEGPRLDFRNQGSGISLGFKVRTDKRVPMYRPPYEYYEADCYGSNCGPSHNKGSYRRRGFLDRIYDIFGHGDDDYSYDRYPYYGSSSSHNSGYGDSHRDYGYD